MGISGPDPDQNQPGQPAGRTTGPAGTGSDVTEQAGRPSSLAEGPPDYPEAPPNSGREEEPATRPLEETAEQPPVAPAPPAPAPPPTPESPPPPAQPPPVTPGEETAEQPPIAPAPPAPESPPPAAPVPAALAEPYGEGPGAWEPAPTDRGGWQPSPRNGFGIAALILGILSILLFPGLGVILGLIGIIFGVLGILRGLRGEATNNGMSITGVVLSAVGLALGGLVAGFTAAVLPSIDGCFDKDNYPTAHDRNDCVKENLPGWVPVND